MSVVYFVQPTDGGPVRVGTSSRIGIRFVELGAWSPIGLDLIAEIPGRQVREAMVHMILTPLAMGRDWFRPDTLLWKMLISAKEDELRWLPDEPALAKKEIIKAELPSRIDVAFGSMSSFSAATGITSKAFSHAVERLSSTRNGPSPKILGSVLLREAELRGALPPYAVPSWGSLHLMKSFQAVSPRGSAHDVS